MKVYAAIVVFIVCLFVFPAGYSNSGDKATIIQFDQDLFQKTITKGIVVVDFWATWCGPCRMQAPIFDDVARTMKKKAKFGKVDVDKNHTLSEIYNVNSIPTIIIFKNSKLVWRFEGVTDKNTLISAINDVEKK